MIDCYKLLGVRILSSYNCAHRSVQMFLETANKTNVILCSASLYLYMNGKVLYP